MPKNISAATLMVLSACIIWGAQPMFVTFVVREFDPIPLVSIRYFTVGVVLLAALAYSGENCCHHARPGCRCFDGRPQRWRQQCCAIYRPAILDRSQPYDYCLADRLP